MKFRVLHLNLAETWGGGEKQVLMLCQGLAARGHEVTLACRQGGPLCARGQEAGLDPVPLPAGAGIVPVASWRLARLIARRRFDLLHSHCGRSLTVAILARTAAVACGGAAGGIVAHRRIATRLHRNPMTRWKYAWGADRVIAVSRLVGGVLAQCGVPTDHIRVVHSGIPCPREPAESRPRVKGHAEGEHVVGCVASYLPVKGLDTLIDAAALVKKQVPATRFLLIGEGPLRTELAAQIRSCNLDGSVQLMGHRTDVPELLRGLDIFVLPSRFEGMPNAVLEAMLSGNAVIATQVGGIPEAVEDGVTGLLVSPNDPSALAAAMVALLEDDSKREAMGSAGRDRVRRYFDEEMTVMKTEALYGEVLAPVPQA